MLPLATHVFKSWALQTPALAAASIGLQRRCGSFALSSYTTQTRSQLDAYTPVGSSSQPSRLTKAQLQQRQTEHKCNVFNSLNATLKQTTEFDDAELNQANANLYHRQKNWHVDFAKVVRRYNFSLPSLFGQVVLAKVLKVTQSHVFVDPGFHNISELPRSEMDVSHVHTPTEGSPLSDRSNMSDLRVGDVVRVKVEYIYTPYGDMQLEPMKQDPQLRQQIILSQLQGMQAARKPVYGRVLNQCPGGYAVGVAGFVALLPYSRATAATAQKIGQLEAFYIEQLDEKRQRITLRDVKLPSRGRSRV